MNIASRIENLEKMTGVGKPKSIVVRVINYAKEVTPCPGYEAKISEAQKNSVNGLIVINCNHDCHESCMASVQNPSS